MADQTIYGRVYPIGIHSLQRIIVSLILATVCPAVLASEPYCIVSSYGYVDGVPAGSGSRVVQDRHGFIWVCTWNGLYRYDGYEFRPIRPDTDNAVRGYSSRFRDIKTGPDGNLWCRIDDNIVLFDVDSYEFHDLQSELEKKTGMRLKIENAIRETTDGDISISISDGRRMIFDAQKLKDGCDPIKTMRIAQKGEPITLKKGNFHRAELPPRFDKNDIAFSTKDNSGNIWIITKDGRIMTASGPTEEFRTITTIDTGGGAVKFSTEDMQGHIWMVSNYGIHKISMGTSPLSYIKAPESSQLRASMLDRSQRVWMAWSDSGFVTVSDSNAGHPLYLSPDGILSDTPVRFGSPVYSMASSPDGHIWLGSKPDGLFRLTPLPDGNGYSVEHFSNEGDESLRHPYDMVFDGKGRLWIATLGNGIEVIERPAADKPQIISLIGRNDYPQDAYKARRIRIIGDSLIAATTTEGLLSFAMPAMPEGERIDFILHRSEPGDDKSLGNIATMDAIAGADGRLYVATESDGINITDSPLTSNAKRKWGFSSVGNEHAASGETTLTLCSLDDGRILAVGKKEIDVLDLKSRNDIQTLGPSFWKKDICFKEVSPLQLPDGRWLIGLEDGAVTIDVERDLKRNDSYPIEFTSCNIEGGGDTALSPQTETITLQPDERALTLTFAALSLSDGGSVRYAYRLDDDDEWTSLGTLRTLTFTRLTPGQHKVSVRSSDLTGRWLDNTRSITISVKPTFRETGLAKALASLAILGLAGGAVWTIASMRRLRRRQRETLEAYLNLLEARTSAAHDHRQQDIYKTVKTLSSESNEESGTIPTSGEEPKVNVDIPAEDKEMISKVVAFIEQNFSDSAITVDDMANAVAVSKSSLTRKMKSLMGVTPADFLRTTRLQKSKGMLTETTFSIKEIALDCGFSDMNYFGKCFKSAYGVTPTAWRTAHNA